MLKSIERNHQSTGTEGHAEHRKSTNTKAEMNKQATSRTATDTRRAQCAGTRSMTNRHLLTLTLQGVVRFR
eukprot:8465363-Alexandrium_andersonii.AAC.1